MSAVVVVCVLTNLVRDLRPIFHIMAVRLALYEIYTYLVLISLIHRNRETGSLKMIASCGRGVKPLAVSYTITVTRI